jgi:aminopeptidase N
MCRRHHLLLGAEAPGFSTGASAPHYAPDLPLEPVHLDVALRFDLPTRSAEGTVTTTVIARDEGARTLRLDAVSFAIASVADPEGHALAWSYDGAKLVVTWADAVTVGDERRVAVTYRVESPIAGLQFSDDPAYIASDHETERARYWLPCVDHPAVRTTLALHLRAPAAWTLLGNGAPGDVVPHDDGTATAHWALAQRCPAYLLCVSMGDYARVDGGTHVGETGPVPIAFFAPRANEEQLTRTFGATRSIMDWMVKRLGRPFPFPKYYQFAVPAIGGAMENISLVSWDDFALLDARGERDWRLRIDVINVHEMAHSYFGDSVVIRDYAHTWLKESWASYMEYCWVEDAHGADEAAFYMSEEVREYRSEADGRYLRPIVTRAFDSAWDMFDMHLYPGGACRLHMLRRKLGERAFWEGVRDYLAAYDGKTADTADFQRCLEARSGQTLARFFDQWFHAPGYPKVKASFAWDAEKKAATVTLEQTQVDAAKGVGRFDLPLTVAFETADGQWERVTTVVTDRRELRVPLAERPKSVVIDPDGDAVFGLDWAPGDDLLTRALRHASVNGRIQAARALGQRAHAKAVGALVEGYRAEAHWGVRVEIARALAAAKTQPAVDALASLLPVETDDRVRPHLVRAAGGFRDDGVARELRALVDGDLGHRTRIAVLECLGQQRGDADLAALTAASRDDGFWGWTQRGAMTALAQTRSPAALPALLDGVATRVRRPARIAATEALGDLGRWLDPRGRSTCVERLSDLTRDPDYGTRLAAVRGLATLGAHEAGGAFIAAERAAAVQDVARIRRAARVAQASNDQGDVAAKLQARVEALEEKVRKLEAAAENAAMSRNDR